MFFEAAGTQQQVFIGHKAIIKIELRPVFAAHKAGGWPHRKTRRIAVHNQRAYALRAGAKAHVNQENGGVRAVGRKHLGARHPVAALYLDGARAQLGDGGAGIGLAHAQGNDLVARQQRAQVFLFETRAGVFGKGAYRPKVAGLNHVGAFRAMQRYLLDGDHRVHQAAALTAIGLG